MPASKPRSEPPPEIHQLIFSTYYALRPDEFHKAVTEGVDSLTEKRKSGAYKLVAKQQSLGYGRIENEQLYVRKEHKQREKSFNNRKFPGRTDRSQKFFRAYLLNFESPNLSKVRKVVRQFTARVLEVKVLADKTKPGTHVVYEFYAVSGNNDLLVSDGDGGKHGLSATGASKVVAEKKSAPSKDKSADGGTKGGKKPPAKVKAGLPNPRTTKQTIAARTDNDDTEKKTESRKTKQNKRRNDRRRKRKREGKSEEDDNNADETVFDSN